MEDLKERNTELQSILRGIKDSIIVLLAAGVSLASIYSLYYF